ncbi:hypothetical protein OG897_33550 [Streptomyces sp. NBC_00237]|uniref:hypothetical protein n=1 Tax=Streptomyces sp. NBC_00237 TaxID=2975687 RepID=UPI0022571FF3|nr:hypothetical protein [Streptomyces sp. NBC_00237]MCX5206319.1 hypothetical protein [Streptomyces sp. NBC_00237]
MSALSAQIAKATAAGFLTLGVLAMTHSPAQNGPAESHPSLAGGPSLPATGIVLPLQEIDDVTWGQGITPPAES